MVPHGGQKNAELQNHVRVLHIQLHQAHMTHPVHPEPLATLALVLSILSTLSIPLIPQSPRPALLLLMGLRAEDPEFSVIHGHRPRLWPGVDGSGSSGGLLALEYLEQQWQDLFTGKRA